MNFYRRRAEGKWNLPHTRGHRLRLPRKTRRSIARRDRNPHPLPWYDPFIQFLRCEQVNVYIDGIRSHDGFQDYVSLSPLDIEAIEVYHGIATVPPEFSPEPNDCAAIVVWTRWHGAQK